MGRIIAQVKVSNPFEEDKTLEFSALVDTGAGALVLPMAWKEKLGHFKNSEPVELMVATETAVMGEVCGPVKIQVQPFRPVFNEVVFLPMEKTEDSDYEPLLGYVILEQIPVAIDMLGHRLVKIKAIDCK